MGVNDADGVDLHPAHTQGTRRQPHPAETGGSAWHASQAARVEDTRLKLVGRLKHHVCQMWQATVGAR
eukprot:3067719-Rhodomonas_salina.1